MTLALELWQAVILWITIGYVLGIIVGFALGWLLAKDRYLGGRVVQPRKLPGK